VKRLFKRLAGSGADTLSRLLYDPFYPAEQVRPDLARQVVDTCRSLEGSSNHAVGRVEELWTDFQGQIRRQLIDHTPAAFLRMQPIGDLLGLGNTAVAQRAWRFLRRSPRWPRYRQVLKEDTVGRPVRFLWMPSTSGCQVHHTSHLASFEEQTGTPVEQLRLIVEFGGGYGSFCRQVHRLGFKGKYLIYDLPELSALQQYFLGSLDFPLLTAEQWADTAAASGVGFINELADLRRVVASLQTAGVKPSLFVATWSISESPAPLRDEVLEIVKAFEHFLMAYQAEFGSVRNTEFFNRWITSRPDREQWKHYPIPINPTSQYLIR
jgi:hypothetical protein